MTDLRAARRPARPGVEPARRWWWKVPVLRGVVDAVWIAGYRFGLHARASVGHDR